MNWSAPYTCIIRGSKFCLFIKKIQIKYNTKIAFRSLTVFFLKIGQLTERDAKQKLQRSVIGCLIVWSRHLLVKLIIDTETLND